ncbi:MAG: outer membrane beta-barrel protein, partial [Lutibacter sp.]|nr:outer membrane beta-barrel protein [Lutibacter sp.]
EVSKKEIAESKFTVATIFAPIYFSSFSDGSGIDAQFKNNPSSGNSSFSYGVKVAYQLTNKFSLQSGINLINLGLTTNNIYVTPGVAIVSFSNLSANPVLARSADIATLKDKTINSDDNSGGSLNQVFGYVEIPVEVKYSLADGKFGVNLVGGFSTLLLNKDEVFVETNSFSQSLGSSNNLRSLNFSGNIGLDIDYSLYKNLFINVSPMFKMQTNTFSKNSGSIQPYYLGVYTGLNYKF